MMFRFDGRTLYDRYRRRKIATVAMGTIYDAHGAKMGKIAGGSVYDKRNARVVNVMGNMVKDAHYKQLTTLSDIKKIIDMDHKETVLAALWYFFIKDKDKR